MPIGMGVTGGKRVRSTVGSMPNKGCIFGSMGDQCIPTGCKEGFAYLRNNGLITYNKGSGGIGRMQNRPGIARLFGNGYQSSI